MGTGQAYGYHQHRQHRASDGRYAPAPPTPAPPPKPVVSTTVIKGQGFSATYELDEDCLATLTERLKLADPATHGTVSSFVEGVLSRLVNFDHVDSPPDFQAYRQGQMAIDSYLSALGE